MLKRRVVLLIVACVLAAASFFWNSREQNTNTANDTNAAVYRECVSDADCATAGCSGQICTTTDRASGIVTTCEARPEYACLERTSCLCIAGFCRFEQNDLYQTCLDDLKNTN